MENIFQGLIAIMDESAKCFSEEMEQEKENNTTVTDTFKVWKDGKLVKTERKRWENGKLVEEMCQETKPNGVIEKSGNCIENDCKCNNACRCKDTVAPKETPEEVTESVEEKYAKKLKKVEEEVDKLAAKAKKLSEENLFLRDKLYFLEKEKKEMAGKLEKIKGLF